MTAITPFKVTAFDSSRKPVSDSLLVNNINYKYIL